MEQRTADASRVPSAATIEAGLSITAGASSGAAHTGRHASARLRPARLSGTERIEIRRRRIEH
jgi:hypothetical protein